MHGAPGLLIVILQVVAVGVVPEGSQVGKVQVLVVRAEENGTPPQTSDVQGQDHAVPEC